MTPQVEPLDSDFLQDPYAVYRRLRQRGPVHRVEIWGGVPAWLVTRYAEARELLADPRLAKDHLRAERLFPPGFAGGARSGWNANMLHTDPPDHTRLRRLVNKAFAARAVQHLRPRIEQVTDELLDTLDPTGPVDLIQSFALPLPIRIIGLLLGVPESDHERFTEWSEPFIDSRASFRRGSAERELAEYLPRLLAAKRANPEPDLLSELAAASADGDRLTEAELLTMTFLLILAGYETTVNLIGNGAHALLTNPARLAELQARPELLPAAVEEFLRIASPVNIATTRFTTEPVRIGEVEIPAGEFVLIGLLAANHDEVQFTGPDELDFTRAVNAHLAFGHGIHYCVGAPLARLEGEVALGRLLARFPGIALDADAPTPGRRQSTLMHGLTALPVRLTAA
ncbi:cytochrome P450 family protein [Crossiella cryophila]|uniref:Cytochrome P450 n=1 Tax=Crossiella cryophila TaxID=43355 RepID=A0A7W7FW79_9PSEU|nr:cytochrome P450 [Crossiella cryophila]MBB4679987.1 cytochrome P450 [Crossiella cryophila]